jgi:PII-like signaling protein
MLPENGHLLRIFLGESDKHEGRPLYDWIVRKAKDQGLAGATVIRGMEGFGASTRIHTAKMIELSTDLPIIIEIVDELDKIENFLTIIDSVVHEGMATVEKVYIRFYRARPHKDKH